MSGDFKKFPFNFAFDDDESAFLQPEDPFFEIPAQMKEAPILQAEAAEPHDSARPSQIVKILDYLYKRPAPAPVTAQRQPRSVDMKRNGKLNWG